MYEQSILFIGKMLVLENIKPFQEIMHFSILQAKLSTRLVDVTQNPELILVFSLS
jgi:hypothetical protein